VVDDGEVDLRLRHPIEVAVKVVRATLVTTPMRAAYEEEG
jgi:hypothetical protein